MNRLIVLVLATLSSTAAVAQHEGHPVVPEPSRVADPHAGHAVPSRPGADEESAGSHASHEMREHRETAELPPAKSPPPEASSGPLHAADALFDPERMEAVRDRLRTEEGGLRHHLFLADRLETGFGDGDERYAWDLQGWYGGDIHRIWFKSEGEGEPGDGTHELEIQALYSRAISPFFDAQLGVRCDVRPDPDRSYVVAGIQGLLPFVFELDAALFLSEKGDLSGRVETEYDLHITQRLVMQPRLEFGFAAQTRPELGIGSGFSSVEAGVRLRYEIRREIAPYVGIAWERTLGDTADFVRASGEDPRSLQLVLGARFWF
jgi:copper resistance protein B